MNAENMDTKEFLLNHNWKFHLGDVPDAWKKDFDDSQWTEILLPHDWSVTLPFSREYSSGTGYTAGGIGWYRAVFTLPEAFRGKRVRITFDGVYKESQVWCNSYYKGFHPNGYTPFSYDITEEAVFGGANEISVRVDHTEISDSRWFTGAGITRKVTLTVSEPVHLAEYGTCFTTLQADVSSARVRIENTIQNSGKEAVRAAVANRLLDTQGKPVLELIKEVLLAPNQEEKISYSADVASPSLWSPSSPALYRLQTWFTVSDGVPYLAGEETVGIRTFSFDPDHGFFLNNTPMKLKGVCVHHDAGALGAAVTSEIWARRLEKLKKMGCNAVRMSHNPHMPELYALCDSMGFLVMDEAFDEWECPKNKWSTGHNVYPPRHEGYYRFFPQYHAQDLRTMILRDRNHPCVILWSIGNEIDYPNDPYCHPLFQTMTGNNDANKPEAERQYNPNRPNAERLAVLSSMLAEEVRRIDTTHPVTLAAAFPELSSHLGFLDALDVAGYNYKEHLYAESHARFPRLPFIGSENGHSLEAWRAVTENEYISGQFLWTGIDYMGEAHGWPWRASGAGLLTLAGFEKTGYYRRMSFWSETPMCHLATGRADCGEGEWKPLLETWNYMPGEKIEVRCYTNLQEAELFLNGKSLGVRQSDPQRDSLSWIVPFEAGVLSVQSRGKLTSILPAKKPQNGTGAETDASAGTASDTLWTSYLPSALKISVYESAVSLPGSPSPLPAKDGYQNSTAQSPIIQAEVSVLDAAGHLAVTDASMICASVTGGELLGIENGDIADCTEYSSPRRRAYHGRLILYVRRLGSGPVRISAEAESLRSASVTLA